MKSPGFVFSLLFIPALLPAQVTDSIVKLPVVEIIDSTMRSAAPVNVLPKAAFEMNPVTDIGDILTQQSNTGGIRKGGYAIDPVIRGYRYSQIRIFLDNGTHIEGGCPNRMDPVMAHLEPEQIEQVEIVKGPYLLDYGSSASASIRLSTLAGEQQFLKGRKLVLISGYETNRNAWRQNVSFRKSNGKYFYAFAGGVKQSDDYRDGKGMEWESSFNKYYLSADAGIRTGNGASVVVSWKGSFARDVMFPALPMDEIKDNTHIFSGLYSKKDPSNPARSFSLSAYHTSVYHLMDNSFRPQYNQIVPPLNGIMQAEAGVYTRSYGFRSALTGRFRSLDVESGIDMHLVQKDGTRVMKMIMQMDGQQFTNVKLTNLWNNAVIASGGVFGKVSHTGQRFNYNATLRLGYDHAHSGDTLQLVNNDERVYDYAAVNRILPSLSTGLVYRAAKNVTVSLALAWSKRAADMQERYIKFLATGYDRFDYLGNPQLKPETNLQTDLMLKYAANSASFSVNVFVSRISDYITGVLLPPAVARPQSLGAPGVKQFRNIDKALFTGFDVSAGLRTTTHSQLSLSAGYTLAWYPEIEKVILENNQPAGTVVLKNDPIAEIPALEAELQYKYHLTALHLKPALTIRGTAAQNRVSQSYGEEKTPGYVIADLAVNWVPVKFVTLSGGIKNLFNTYYYDHLNRRLLSTSVKLYEPGRSFYVLLKITI